MSAVLTGVYRSSPKLALPCRARECRQKPEGHWTHLRCAWYSFVKLRHALEVVVTSVTKAAEQDGCMHEAAMKQSIARASQRLVEDLKW